MKRTIRELRLLNGYSQSQLAHRLGVTRGTVNRWETGAHAPSYENLRALGRTFQVPMHSIALIKGEVEQIIPRTVIYCRRVARRGGTASRSVDIQESNCRSYVDEQEYQLVEVMHEAETFSSASPLWDRPELRKLRSLVIADAIDIIVCDNLDTLTTDRLELGLLYDEARNNKVRIETPFAGAKASAEAGLDHFVADNSELIYSLRKAYASMRGRLDRVRAGKPLASALPPYGYQWRDEGKSGLAIDPETGPIVERIFEEAELGQTLREIAEGLTTDGIKTPSAKSRTWQGGTIHSILHNPAYMGEAYGWRSSPDRARTVERRRKGIRLPATAVPPIVSEDTWESVQEQLRHNWGKIHRLRRAGVRI